MAYVKRSGMVASRLGRNIFKKSLVVGATDHLEFDEVRKEVRVVNLHGKVKDKTTYKYVELVDGPQTTAGTGEDTRGMGEGSSEGDTKKVPLD